MRNAETLTLGSSRVPIIAIVVGLHAVLAYVFHHEASQRVRKDRPSSSMTVVFIQERPVSSMIPPPQDNFLRNPELRTLTPPDVQAPTAIPPIAEPDEPNEPSTALTNWYAQLPDAARAIVQREAEIASRKVSPQSREALAKPEVRKPERRAGTVERFDGAERHWVSGNCYLEFTREAPPPPSLRMARPDIIRCTASGSSSNGHLFDSAKPDYLRNDTPRE